MPRIATTFSVGVFALCSACAGVVEHREQVSVAKATPTPSTVAGVPEARALSSVDAPDAGDRSVAADGYVLVRHDAWVRAAPTMEAERARLMTLDPNEDPDPLRLHQVAAVAERNGPFVRLQTRPITYDDAGCHAATGRATLFQGFELRVWVHEDDLVEVLVRPVEHEFEGSHLALLPGVAVGPVHEGVRRVAHDSMTLTAAIPDASVGKIFQAPFAFHPELLDSHLCAEAPCSLKLAPQAQLELEDSVGLEVLERDGEAATVALRTRCVAVTTVIPFADVLPGRPPRFAGGTACGGYSIGKDFLAWPGALVEFADGTRAGAVGKRGALLRRHNRKDDPERACFARGPLDDMGCAGGDQHLTLCMPLDEVTLMPPDGLQ